MTAVGVISCDVPRDSTTVESGSEPETLAQVDGARQTVNVPDPNGTYFAEVKANGTGCPPGSWLASIAPDGQVFTITFSSYVAEVFPALAMSVKDCQLAIRMHTPEGRSFSVQRFAYSGYALLQQGVLGRQTASYYFQGRPVDTQNSNRTELVGPYDRPYLFVDEVPIDERNWSECGLERDLNISTRLMVQNDTKRSGYMNLTAIDASGKLELSLASRLCNSDGTPRQPVTNPDPTPTKPEPDEPPPVPPTTLGKPAQVKVTPSSIRRDQPFTISWTPNDAPDSTYVVELHEHYDFGYKLVWSSPAISGRSIVYNGGTIAKAGLYHVVVVARDGDRMALSDRVLLDVRELPNVTPVVPDPPPVVPDPPPVVSPSALPAWAQPLLGQYALRTNAFAVTSSGAMMAGDSLALAEFVERNGRLELQVRSCAQTTRIGSVSVSVGTPEAYPLQTRRVILEPGERWSSAPTPIAYGFIREGVPECRGRTGQSVPKRADQTWIRGSTCRCASAGDVPRIDDCRVIDADGDGQPGLASVFSGGNRSHSVGVIRGYHVGGRVDPSGRHVAQYVNDEVAFELACEGTCGGGESWRPCTAEHNRSEFSRLPPISGGGSWTCGTLLASPSRFFGAPTSTPRTCARGSVTSTP